MGVFRDYAQGAFRMRGIGKGQTIKLLVVPEILVRIRTQVAVGKGLPVPDNSNELSLESREQIQQFLNDVIAWLVINSMRVDGIQFNLLCEQNVANIWRKGCFAALLANTNTEELAKARISPEISKALRIFRERIDFEIE